MKDKDDDVQRVWDLMEKIGFCMLITREGEGMRARPMSPHMEQIENAIYFLTDANSPKEAEVEQIPLACLAFADSRDMKFVSISGEAKIINDREKIEYLWSTPAKAWWDNPDDPSIRVLSFTPTEAEYWDSPGKIISYIKMAAAAVTDMRPNMGDSAKVSL